MTPPTQSDARWEVPEWLVEKSAIGIVASREGRGLRRQVREEVRRDLTAALSECPVLGLTREEVAAILRAAHSEECLLTSDMAGWTCQCGLDSVEAKLLATREALEREGRDDG